MAITIPVNAAQFLDVPTIADKVGETPQEIRTTRQAFFERLEMEHEMAAAANSNHGRHNVGSARVYVSDVKNVTMESPIYSAVDGYQKGRAQFYPTGGIVKVHNGTDQAEIGYLATRDVDQSVAGIITFDQTPLSTAVTAPVGNTELVNKKQVDDLITTAMATMQDLFHPVGYEHIVYPGSASPTAMGWAGTWGKIDTYASKVFRVVKDLVATKGPSALGVAQAQNVGKHTHTATVTGGSGNGVGGYATSGDLLANGFFQGKSIDSFSTSVAIADNSADADNRMDCVGIEVWKRTA